MVVGSIEDLAECQENTLDDERGWHSDPRRRIGRLTGRMTSPKPSIDFRTVRQGSISDSGINIGRAKRRGHDFATCAEAQSDLFHHRRIPSHSFVGAYRIDHRRATRWRQYGPCCCCRGGRRDHFRAIRLRRLKERNVRSDENKEDIVEEEAEQDQCNHTHVAQSIHRYD